MSAHSDTMGARRATPRDPRRWSGEIRLADPAVLIVVTTAALVVLGLVMILSASSVASFETYGTSYLFFNKQLLWAGVGVVGFLFFYRLDYRKLRGLGYVFYGVVAAMLAAVLVPGMGVFAGGSSRWIDLGPLSFQPSELAKLALIVFGADVFARKKERSLAVFAHTALPMVPALGGMALLVMLQPDLGTTVLLGVIGLGMLFAAGSPRRYVVPIGVLGGAVATVAAVSASYRRARILAFLHPWADPLNTGYQTIQSLIALGSGRWFGVGLGASRQKWMYVPNAHTDFIFSILGEEMGLLGTLAVVGLFSFLAYMGLRTARKAPDRFGMLLATGITIWISSQALINIGAVTASLPVTGVPLPLVSFGGTSLVISLAAMGILANIARQSGGPGRTRPRRPRA